MNFWIDQEYGLNSSNSISYYGKGVFELILLVYIWSKKESRHILLLMFVFLLFPLLWFVFSNNFIVQGKTFQQVFMIIKEGNKYMFPIIIFMAIKSMQLDLKYTKPVFEAVYIFSALIVLVSFLSNWTYFHTYGGERFGYKPPLATQNEITFFWMIGVIYFVQKLLSKKNIVNVIILFLVMLASMFLGTKAVLLFGVCLALFVVVFLIRDRNVKALIFISMLIIITAVFYFSGLYDFFFDIYKEKGIWYAVTSKRNVLLTEEALPMLKSWSWYNYLIGGAVDKFPVTEMDIIDLFLFGGVVGSVLYYWLLFKTIFHFSKNNYIGWFLVSQYFLIGGLAGHVFASGINAIYLALTSYYLQKEQLSPAPCLSGRQAPKGEVI